LIVQQHTNFCRNIDPIVTYHNIKHVPYFAALSSRKLFVIATTIDYCPDRYASN
jgi:hypothetical protein